MSAKTEPSELSKKVHSYFASLSSTSSRILDDVKSISLASRRSHRSWNNLSDKEKSNIVMDSLVPDDIEQRYRSLDGDGLSPLGVPSSQMESLIDASQAFPVVEISTLKPMPRSVVIEEDVHGRKVPITWRDEHSVPFSWYNQSCEEIVAVPPPFVCLTSPDDVDHSQDISRESSGAVSRVSRHSSRASTPERRRSPLMRPKHAPPPPPASKDSNPDRKKETPATAENSLTSGGDSRNSASQESISSAHGQSMRSTSSAPQHQQRKRQAPKPPVSPVVPQVPERSSNYSLTSIGSNCDRPRSTFCPADDPHQPHILPEALAPEKPECKYSPMLQTARSKAPPQQLKKVCPPVAPKIETRPSATESTAPCLNDNIPKTGFDFLDNW